MKKTFILLTILLASMLHANNIEQITTVEQAQLFVQQTNPITIEQLAILKQNVTEYKQLSDDKFNNTIFTPLLKTGRYDVSYQAFFKQYVYNISLKSNKNALSIIENELKVFLGIIKEGSAEQLNWLNMLRLYNTVYSEL